ncbi:hypothetical protein FQN53_009492 [Emmonsiellopsis sp. PD_33]|nr:hypothetical protein FQN53_009492 [Emmonsiellopsis sp. PD_33]
MATLDSLPMEILLDIQSFITIKDLAALSLQCRRLHDALSDMMARRRYRRLRVDGDYLPGAFMAFVEILKAPRFGSNVKEIVHGPDRRLIKHMKWRPLTDENELSLFRAAMAKAGFEGKSADHLWAALNPKGGLDRADGNIATNLRNALVVLLLAVCPNVETLRETSIRGRFHDDLFKRACGTPHGNLLRNLRHIDFLRGKCLTWDTETVIMQELLSIQRLPSIERITLRGVCEMREDAWSRYLMPGVSSVKKIEIGYFRIQPRDLRWIIQNPKALEEFQFSSGQLRRFDPYDDWLVNPRLLGKVLLCHKSTLRVLDLDVDNVVLPGNSEDFHSYDEEEEDFDDLLMSNMYNVDERDRPHAEITDQRFKRNRPDTRPYGQTIGSMHDFIALKRLSIGVQLLCGEPHPELTTPGWRNEHHRVPIRLITALPPNLEYLCIRGYVPGKIPHYTRQIEEFMGNRDRWPASLKEVHGVEECVEGRPFLCHHDQWGDSDDGNNRDGPGPERLPWEETEDEWTDYSD